MRVVALACLLLAGLATCDEVKSYRGYHVVSAKATTQEQLALLQNLDSTYDVTFLREPSLVVSTDMVVSPEQQGQLVNTLRNAGIAVTVASTDLQADIDAEMQESRRNARMFEFLGRMSSNFDPAHNFYRTLAEVNDVMEGFEKYYPNLVVRKPMSHRTHENRIVYYLEIGTATDQNGNWNKPVIFIESLAHAREWATTASILYVIHQMLKGYESGDRQIVDVLTKFTWVIVPVVNPDGYQYTWTYNRMWRKNRNPNSGKNCEGVDLNRNYDVKFGTVGVSFDCRTDIYPGPSPFSEPETQNIRDLFRQLKSRVVSFLSVHAYSQLLLHPWGYSQSWYETPDNINRLVEVGRKMKTALQSQGMTYSMGTPYQVLGYAAAGGAEDWALKEKPGILSYCIELRPRDERGGHFALPPRYIVPTGTELFRSVVVLAQNSLR